MLQELGAPTCTQPRNEEHLLCLLPRAAGLRRSLADSKRHCDQLDVHSYWMAILYNLTYNWFPSNKKEQIGLRSSPVVKSYLEIGTSLQACSEGICSCAESDILGVNCGSELPNLVWQGASFLGSDEC